MMRASTPSGRRPGRSRTAGRTSACAGPRTSVLPVSASCGPTCGPRACAPGWGPDVAGGALRVADFRQLWLGHSVSLIGTQITLLAFPLLALAVLDASPLQVRMLAAVEFLPVLLLGLPAGAWVARLPRRPVLIVTDLVRAAA